MNNTSGLEKAIFMDVNDNSKIGKDLQVLSMAWVILLFAHNQNLLKFTSADKVNSMFQSRQVQSKGQTWQER